VTKKKKKGVSTRKKTIFGEGAQVKNHTFQNKKGKSNHKDGSTKKGHYNHHPKNRVPMEKKSVVFIF